MEHLDLSPLDPGPGIEHPLPSLDDAPECTAGISELSIGEPETHSPNIAREGDPVAEITTSRHEVYSDRDIWGRQKGTDVWGRLPRIDVWGRPPTDVWGRGDNRDGWGNPI